MKQKVVQGLNSTIGTIGQFQHYSNGHGEIIQIDPMGKENLKLRPISSQTSKEVKEDSWDKLRNTFSNSSGINRTNSSVNEKRGYRLKETKAVVETTTTGVQVDLSCCTDCPGQIKDVEDVEVRPRDSEKDSESPSNNEACQREVLEEGSSESGQDMMEFRGSGEVGGSETTHHCQVDKGYSDERQCDVKGWSERYGEGDGVSVHNDLDLHCDGDGSEEESETNQDENTTLEEDNKILCFSTIQICMSVRNMTTLCLTVFALMCLCVCVSMWVKPDGVHTTYLPPILSYFLNNGTEKANTEEAPPFWRRFCDYWFSVTYTRF